MLKMYLIYVTILILILNINLNFCHGSRSFEIDFDNDVFLKDGQPFRYVSGSIHYFRVPEEYWKDRLMKMRAAGLNAIETYIEWNSHEPEPEDYDFNGQLDLIKFIKTAEEVGLLVILRLGPFIDAERDMGGFPYWLLSENNRIALRTKDSVYLKYVERWYSVLLPKLRPLTYSNGGPIIMMQIENEYGSYPACDFEYTAHLRDVVKKYIGKDMVYFTTDGNGHSYLKCGKISGVYTTIDFGPGTDVKSAFQIQRIHQEHGPLVNSEYYPGWLDNWGSPHNTRSVATTSKTLEDMLALNASVNIYMFHGGTSFGFGAGAEGNDDEFAPNPTSYDYDAPLDESGDPTEKYHAFRNIIGKYLPLPSMPVPEPSPKMSLGPIQMERIRGLFETYLNGDEPVVSQYPLSFEQLKLRHGFVKYSVEVKEHPSDPSVIDVQNLRDRGMVFVDNEFKGTLSRTQKITKLPVDVHKGSIIDILVENQGRVCVGSSINELKGLSNVTLGPVKLTNWTHTILFKNWSKIIDVVEKEMNYYSLDPVYRTPLLPAFYGGSFTLSPTQQPLDTFLRVDDWRKGVAFLNGFNLGRYWPSEGPQVTLYIPGTLIKPYPQKNSLILLELESAPCSTNFKGNANCVINLIKHSIINGSVPFQ